MRTRPTTRDESYIIDLCDRVLKSKAKRQHRFDFMRGDSGTRLPVDAYYGDLHLVTEYREKQHFEPVPHFDRRPGRREQRERYDQLRRDELPKHGLRLVEFEYSMFQVKANKRLKRNTEADETVIRGKLADLLPTISIADLGTVTSSRCGALPAIFLLYGWQVLDDLDFCREHEDTILRYSKGIMTLNGSPTSVLESVAANPTSVPGWIELLHENPQDSKVLQHVLARLVSLRKRGASWHEGGTSSGS